MRRFPLLCVLLALPACRSAVKQTPVTYAPLNRQLTFAPHSHVLTNVNAFSPDGRFLVYDTRSAAGESFDADRIERVNVATGEVDVVYRAAAGAKCGVVTYDTKHNRVVFILGPDSSDPAFTYGAARRQGVVVDVDTGRASNLDARDFTPPFTPGALRGGTHVHVFSPDGTRVSSTYEDHVLDQLGKSGDHDLNQRNLAVSLLGRPVRVPAGPHAHDGEAFTVLVTRTTNAPEPGTDQISRAFEEAWIGRDGYTRADGTKQKYALAFQGNVVTPEGKTISEVFVVDLSDDLTRPGDAPLEGTPTRRPAPPAGCTQRRLTFTAARPFPGIQGPRHWLRSAPDGSQIAYLAKDDVGVVQLFLVPPAGGPPRQLSHDPESVDSAFTWSPDGRWIAHVRAGRVCVTDTTTGQTHRLTPPSSDPVAKTACVFSPDGRSIAYVREKAEGGTGKGFDQIWRVNMPNDPTTWGKN